MSTRVQGSLYDFPAYYDLVFGSDWKPEFDFLEDCFERYVSFPVERLYEPACGTGRLLYRFAKAGYEVGGLDLNERAVEYCNRRLQRHGFGPAAWVGDMTDFHLPRPAHASFNTINTFRHLDSDVAARRHLKAMARCLDVGAIYVVGLHLTPTAGEPIEEECWSARRGHLCVNTRMWLVEQDLDRRVETYGMTFDVHTPTKHIQLFDEIEFRTYTQAQFDGLLRDVPGFSIAGIYDFHYDIRRPLDVGPETEDAVYVLRREA